MIRMVSLSRMCCHGACNSVIQHTLDTGTHNTRSLTAPSAGACVRLLPTYGAEITTGYCVRFIAVHLIGATEQHLGSFKVPCWKLWIRRRPHHLHGPSSRYRYGLPHETPLPQTLSPIQYDPRSESMVKGSKNRLKLHTWGKNRIRFVFR